MKHSSLKTGVLAITLSVLAVAASPAWSGEADYLIKEGAKIGIALPGINMDCLTREGKFLQQSFKRDGYIVSVYFDESCKSSLSTISSSSSMISRMLDDGCQVVIVGSTTSKDLQMKIQDAHANDIRILTYGTMLVNPYDTECLEHFVVSGISDQTVSSPGADKRLDPGCIEVFSGVRAGTEFDADILEAVSVISPYVEKGAVLMRELRTELRGLINDYDYSFIDTDAMLALASPEFSAHAADFFCNI